MSEAHKTLKKKPSWICEYCEKEFSFPSHLASHRRAHTGDRPFSCNLCNFSTSYKSEVGRHIRRHLKEKPFKCPESGCNHSASSKSNVTKHHKTVHLRQKRFECPISNCRYETGVKSSLTRHMKTHEENPEKPFKCELCPFKSMTAGNLESHMNTVHSKERNFTCSQNGCGFSAKTRGELNRHWETHGEKNLACSHPNCEYKTHKKYCLKNHMKNHSSESDSEKKHKCRLCDYSSHHAHNLTRHMRTHTKETPYKCKFQGCSFQAKESSSIKQHVRVVHEEIRPF